MTVDLKKALIETRTEMECEIVKMKHAITAIDELLGVYAAKPKSGMVTGIERRKGGVKQVIEALKQLGSGSINEISNKVQALFPVVNEQSLYSKTATYLKRLHGDGLVTFSHNDDSYKTKIYTLNAVNNNL